MVIFKIEKDWEDKTHIVLMNSKLYNAENYNEVTKLKILCT